MRLRGGGEAAMTRQTISFLEGPDLDVHYINHHLCHAAAFLMSPFDEAAIMTVDAFVDAMRRATDSADTDERLARIEAKLEKMA